MINDMKRCKSSYQCSPDKPGEKMILPEGCKFSNCENCRARHNVSSRKYAKNNPEKIYESHIKCIANEINDNPIISKGTLRARKYKANKKLKGKPQMTAKQLYNDYKNLSKSRYKEFSLSYEEFNDFVNDDCHYCGVKNTMFNGIDRLDHHIGYIKDNCVPCCKYCNLLKNTLNESSFVLMISHIVCYNALHDDAKLYPHVINNHKGNSFILYQRRSKKLNISFELTEKQFDHIVSDQCHLCGKENTPIHSNGVDRIDNGKGYILSNCQCCHDCNIFKKNLDYHEFLEHCVQIFNHNKFKLEQLSLNWTPSQIFERRSTNPPKKERKKRIEENKIKRIEEKKIRHSEEGIQQRIQCHKNKHSNTSTISNL